MRSIRRGDGLNGVDADFIVDHLHLLGLTDGDGAGIHSEEDTIPDYDLAGLLYNNTGWWEMAEGG